MIPPRRPGSTRIILVRHGRAAVEPGRICGRLDPPLSVAGRTEIARVARWLSRVGFGTVHASPARRAQESARLLARGRDVTVREVPELREVDFGRLEGLTWGEAVDREPAACAAWLSQPHQVAFPSGEGFEDVRARVRSALAALLERHAGQVLLVVAHAGPNRAILAEALGVPPEAAFALGQRSAAVNVVDWLGRRALPRMVNYACPGA